MRISEEVKHQYMNHGWQQYSRITNNHRAEQAVLVELSASIFLTEFEKVTEIAGIGDRGLYYDGNCRKRYTESGHR